MVNRAVPRRRNYVEFMGHEVVGEVVGYGENATGFAVGYRVGVSWPGDTCRDCGFCASHHENLCDHAVFIGYDRDGGYAEYTVADARYCFAIPSRYDDLHAAPLLRAGLIGYRAYTMCADAQRIGLYGFGAVAHIIAQGTRAKGGRYTHSHGRETAVRKTSRACSGRPGPAIQLRFRRLRSMLQSSSRRSAHWCRRRLQQYARAGRWCAREYT